MDVHILCPACRKQLSVADGHLGRAVRCPGCQAVFQIRHPGGIRLTIGSATSSGMVRERNEDSLLCTQIAWAAGGAETDLALLAVFDGMGGHAGGDRAAALAVSGLAASLLPRLAVLIGGEPIPDAEGLLEMLDVALWEANRTVFRVGSTDPALTGMGATAVAALVLGGTVALCHVGDCRAYLARGGSVGALTVDQTLARRMVELGTLSEKQARNHPSASQVTQALGRQADIEPSRQILTLTVGDTLILACDGLHAHLDEATLSGIVACSADPGTVAQTLIDTTNAAGGSDNCTVVVARLGRRAGSTQR